VASAEKKSSARRGRFIKLVKKPSLTHPALKGKYRRSRFWL
jgi:hypothetical protein